MKKALATLAAVALSLVVGLPTQASGVNKTRIVNSGNGAYNSIAVHNHHGHGPGGYAPGFMPPAPVGYGPAPVGYGPAQPFQLPTVGGVNINTIVNSANGQGNSIDLRNGGGFSYSYPGGVYGGVPVGGVNINTIVNSGNGVGNAIGIRNR